MRLPSGEKLGPRSFGASSVNWRRPASVRLQDEEVVLRRAARVEREDLPVRRDVEVRHLLRALVDLLGLSREPVPARRRSGGRSRRSSAGPRRRRGGRPARAASPPTSRAGSDLAARPVPAAFRSPRRSGRARGSSRRRGWRGSRASAVRRPDRAPVHRRVLRDRHRLLAGGEALVRNRPDVALAAPRGKRPVRDAQAMRARRSAGWRPRRRSCASCRSPTSTDQSSLVPMRP